MAVFIIGCGAMGGLLALYYYRATGESPYCVVRRRSHAESLRHNGLSVDVGEESLVVPVKPLLGVTSLKALHNTGDSVLVAVKAYDLAGTLSSLAQAGVGEGVGVLVNGVSMPWKALEAGVSGFLMISDYGVTRLSDAHVSVRGEGSLVAGYPSLLRAHAMDPELPCRIAALLRVGGANAWCTDRIDYYMWLKAAANAAINGPASILGVENGFLLENPQARLLLERLASRMALAARLSGVALGESEAVSYAVDVASRTRGNKSSMLQDLEACRRTEADDIYVPAIRVLLEKSLDPGVLETVYLLVKSIEEGRLRCGRR